MSFEAGDVETGKQMKGDSFRRMQELTAAALTPSREIQRLMDDALEPARQMQKLMDDALAPTRQIRELTAAALAPSREIQNLMDGILAPTWQMHKLIEDVLAAPSCQVQRLIGDMLTAFPQPPSGHMLEPSAWLSIETQLRQTPVFKIQEEIARSLSAFAHLRMYPDDMLTTLRQCAGLVSNEELRRVADIFPEVNPDGSVTLGGEAIAIEEIESAIAAFFTHILEVGSDLALVIRRWRRPVQALIVHIVIPLLVNYSVCLYFAAQSSRELQELQQQFDAQTATTRREVMRVARALAAPSDVDLQWCVVTGDGLRVRSRPSTRATIKTTLRIGTVVRFIEKRGRWTRIQFDIQNAEELVDGWVFNKYLTRVR